MPRGQKGISKKHKHLQHILVIRDPQSIDTFFAA
jgi:hypothetical protein